MEDMLREMAAKNIAKAQDEVESTLSGLTSLASFKDIATTHPLNDLISELSEARKRLNGAAISIQKWGLEDGIGK